MNKSKAVFLDKDGTLIPDIPYNINPDLITLTENAVNGLTALQQAGYMLVIISNQSGVARGYFSEADLMPVKSKLQQLLQPYGLLLNAFYYCPHHPEGHVIGYATDCNCRKPRPGMILQAGNDLNIDLTQSWMIGDILNDVEAGNQAGCRSILVNNGNETEWIINSIRTPEAKVLNINQAAAYILSALPYGK